MSLGYVHEKFILAVDSMATSPASIQNRVADAYMFHLMHLKEDELPEEIRMDFRIMKQQLTSAKPIGDEGSVMASVNEMSEDDAVAIAQKIVNMHGIVNSHLEEES
jgi:hypothetical protein